MKVKKLQTDFASGKSKWPSTGRLDQVNSLDEKNIWHIRPRFAFLTSSLDPNRSSRAGLWQFNYISFFKNKRSIAHEVIWHKRLCAPHPPQISTQLNNNNNVKTEVEGNSFHHIKSWEFKKKINKRGGATQKH